jgi:prepilin-type N-terminal cleavage/methylation domain-containing protein
VNGRDRQSGFTLPEVIMAVTILGIIGATIAAVITAAFSSTTGVRERYDASRAAKQAAVYWTPDVESAEAVNPGGMLCGSGTGAAPRDLVTFAWTEYPSVTETASPDPAAPGTGRLATWWLDDTEPRQIVRRECLRRAPAVVTDEVLVTRRIAAADADRVTVGCADDGLTFADCGLDDTGAAVVRLRADVMDTPKPPSQGAGFTTYTFTVTGNREVR